MNGGSVDDFGNYDADIADDDTPIIPGEVPIEPTTKEGGGGSRDGSTRVPH
jgi:hypothetical protein